MVQIQIINKILETKDYSIIERNLLDVSYFDGYETEYNFITNHYNQYKTIPDKITFIERFPNFNLIDVQESEQYLIDKIREEKLYRDSTPVVQKIADLLKTDSNKAVEYMIQATKDIKPNYNPIGVDIIQSVKDRYDEYIDKTQNKSNYFFKSGLDELDQLIQGIQRGEEFMVIVARMGVGKSWLIGKMSSAIWQQGYNVGFVSPEMSANSIGYRFDTLVGNFSNSSLVYGGQLDGDYKKFLKDLKTKNNKFVVTTPKRDFNNKITISKLRNWIKTDNLDCLFIDGITYLTDERYKSGDNKTTSLTNLSEDLMSLSVELNIPVITVVQANRNAAGADNTPELETIRDSDGLGFNATKVIAIKNQDGVLDLSIKKNRNGKIGNTIKYYWDIDRGTFLYAPSEKDGLNNTQQIQENRDKFKDKKETF